MGRALAAVAALLVLCLGILGIVVVASRTEDRVAVDQILAEDLSRAIALADGEPDPVVVAAITTFDWDELLIVAPRTPRRVLDEALGFEFKGDLPYDAESQELLVFVSGGRLARFADYRGRGTFTGLDRPIARFTPETAVFRVRNQTIHPAA